MFVFLVFERRTFCRYLCPLTALIGSAGSMGVVAGFRTRDRNTCLTCRTKACIRGTSNTFACPWSIWPGSADSNLQCGLCTQCFKACPTNNVGMFLQKPLTSLVGPSGVGLISPGLWRFCGVSCCSNRSTPLNSMLPWIAG